MSLKNDTQQILSVTMYIYSFGFVCLKHGIKCRQCQRLLPKVLPFEIKPAYNQKGTSHCIYSYMCQNTEDDEIVWIWFLVSQMTALKDEMSRSDVVLKENCLERIRFFF